MWLAIPFSACHSKSFWVAERLPSYYEVVVHYSGSTHNLPVLVKLPAVNV